MKNKYKKPAFTLIELLVVITIIGILSTVGLATFNGYIEKAHTTKIGSFSKEVSTELKRQAVIKETKAVGIWNFDNTFDDLSGNGNTPSVEASNVTFQESDSLFLGSHYVHFDGGRILTLLGSAEATEFSVSYMVKYPVANAAGYPIYLGTDAGQITNNGGSGNLFWIPFSVNIVDAVDDERWHHVLFTYKDSTFKVWVDGELRQEVSHTLTGLSTLSWFRSGNGGGGSNMYLDSLEIYPFAVDPSF